MVSLKSLFTFAASSALTIAAPLSTRSLASDIILSDLQTLDASVRALTKDIQSYSGGLLTAPPILFGVTGVHLANRKAYLTSLTPGVPVQSYEDSKVIVDYVADPIAVDIPNSVAILKSKKALFVKDGLVDTVIASLDLLKYDHDSLSASLEKKVDPALLDEAEVYVERIHDAIQSGIDYFSS